MLIERVSDEEAIKFLEHAFRNVNRMPALTHEDLREIADGLFHFLLRRGGS